MARIVHDEAFHQSELEYIKGAWPSDKANFRGNRSVFNQYIEMQAGFAHQDGFSSIADTMLSYRQFVPHSKR